MNKKIIAGAVIALAAGVATFFYGWNKNKINATAADAYNKTSAAINQLQNKAENTLS